MAFPSVDEAVEVYRNCARVPSLSSAAVHRTSTGFLSVHSTWSQRDLDRESNVKFSCTHLVTLNGTDGKISEVVNSGSISELNSEQLVQWSPSGQLKAVLRKVKDKKGDEKQYMEVWNNQRKIHNINLTALENHGKVNEDGEFGSLEWSKDESKLLYVAEKKQPKATSYFDKTKEAESCGESPGSTSKKEAEVKLGDQFVYHQEWGEQLVGKHHPVPCILDLDSGKVTIPEGVPDDVSVGQAVWTPDGHGIVFTGWQNQPYRLGLIFCKNRRSAIYHLDLASKVCETISVTDQSVRTPKFSPNGSRLVYIRNPCHGPHHKCGQLVVYDWTSRETRVAHDVHTPTEQKPFPGLYVSRFEHHCWLDNDRMITSSVWRSNKAIMTINITTGEVVRLTDDKEFGSWTFCDITSGFILAFRASPVNSGQLVLGALPQVGDKRDIDWRPLHEPCLNCTDLEWSIVKMEPPSESDTGVDFEVIVMKPKTSKDKSSKPPLIVWPHGGPHSAFASDYLIFCTAFCRLGFVIALVNYRGSIGFGQASVDSLLGFVGTNDVQDVQATAEEVLRLGWADPGRVAVCGGSHGGFLSTHMVGQYPDFYKACCTRNPVTNLAAMHGTSDIPSWTMTEVGIDFEFSKAPSAEMYTKMFNSSPMAHVHKVKAPTLIMLGADDLRVPPAQGQRFHQMLKARGVKTRLLVYPDNNHPISKVDAEADCFMNIYVWLTEHLSA